MDNNSNSNNNKSRKTLLIIIGVVIVLLIGIGIGGYFWLNTKSTKNIYYKSLDKLSEMIEKVNEEKTTVLDNEID